MKKLIRISMLACVCLALFASCETTGKFPKNEDIYKFYIEIDKEMPGEIHDLILESTPRENPTYNEPIWPQQVYGIVRNPWTRKMVFRDYIAYPYYGIRKFKNPIPGTLSYLLWLAGEVHITISTKNLEFEYFGRMNLNPDLEVGREIPKGTYLGEMTGGGDSGMTLKIRMRYKGIVVDPSPWFGGQIDPGSTSSSDENLDE